jgi:hypothetical protein
MVSSDANPPSTPVAIALEDESLVLFLWKC